MVSILYTIITPMPFPLICTLWNKEVKSAKQKLWDRSGLTWKKTGDISSWSDFLKAEKSEVKIITLPLMSYEVIAYLFDFLPLNRNTPIYGSVVKLRKNSFHTELFCLLPFSFLKHLFALFPSIVFFHSSILPIHLIKPYSIHSFHLVWCHTLVHPNSHLSTLSLLLLSPQLSHSNQMSAMNCRRNIYVFLTLTKYLEGYQMDQSEYNLYNCITTN